MVLMLLHMQLHLNLFIFSYNNNNFLDLKHVLVPVYNLNQQQFNYNFSAIEQSIGLNTFFQIILYIFLKTKNSRLIKNKMKFFFFTMCKRSIIESIEISSSR